MGGTFISLGGHFVLMISWLSQLMGLRPCCTIRSCEPLTHGISGIVLRKLLWHLVENNVTPLKSIGQVFWTSHKHVCVGFRTNMATLKTGSLFWRIYIWNMHVSSAGCNQISIQFIKDMELVVFKIATSKWSRAEHFVGDSSHASVFFSHVNGTPHQDNLSTNVISCGDRVMA